MTDLVRELGLTREAKDAQDATVKVNSAFYEILDFEDTSEGDCAARGLIDAPEKLDIKDADGTVVWSQSAYDFLHDYEKAPKTVNPSLWENTKNNHYYGLFEVTDGIYQIRGYDMTNLTLIKGETGWIVFDPLMSKECSLAAMELVKKNLGDFPVKAVVISHPHVDHYGGIAGVMSAEQAADPSLSFEEQVASGRIPIIVPESFTEHAVSENIYAGKAMGRRAAYQYGTYLNAALTGGMAIGIGMGQSLGTVTFVTPTYEVKRTGEILVVDGITMEFQMTPGTEAPAEMNTWFPQKKALWMAENCTGTLHNLYTLRGAQIRDGAAWSDYICEAFTLYGEDVEVVFQSHNWPHWGNSQVKDYLINTAAMYRFINDQTLTYLNQGYTSAEISHMIRLPGALEKNWYTRQYYGTVSHNAKAVYQKYMGWYDANPVHLNPLLPEENGKKWMEYMGLGNVDKVLRKAKEDFDVGQYQWVAEVTNTIIFAEPKNEAARLLCADALEQLGYQSESGTWRNVYLSGALELRQGNRYITSIRAKSSGDLLANMTTSMMFDYMGICLDKSAMEEDDFTMKVTLTDVNEIYLVRVKNGVLLKFAANQDTAADITITTVKKALMLMMKGPDVFGKAAKIEGNIDMLSKFMSHLNQLTDEKVGEFNLVEP